jgi:soluble lytic murein transglycosylase
MFAQLRLSVPAALSALLLACAGPVPAQNEAAPVPTQTDVASRAWLSGQFAAYDAGARNAPYGAPSDIARSLATWDWLRRTPAVGAEPPLLEQMRFIADHPGWPGLAAIRRRAEAQAADIAKTSDGSARAFLTALPPESAAGQARLALVSTGPEAQALARAAWVRPGIPAELETVFWARFGPMLTRADHARRADRLIWAGQTSAAARLLPFLDADERALAEARIALRSGAPDAESRAAMVPARFLRHPGLRYDRALFAERRGRLSEAEALLGAGDTEAGVAAPETWLEKRLALGRAAMRRGEFSTAYRLLANHRAYPATETLSALPLSQRVDLSDTEWLAGWIALRRLNRPEDAARHFETFNRIVTTPISQSRGEYWLGRALKAAGRMADANAAFERGARHFDYFYGQLAAEELGRTPALPTVPPAVPTAAERQAFDARSLTRALLLLNETGHRERQSMFVRAVADATQTPGESRLAAELGQRLRRPDLGVWAWKAARPRGDLNGFDLAYPRLPGTAALPSREWLIAHAIARQESSFDRTARSSAGARGLMQLMPGTAQDVAAKLGQGYSPQRLFDDPAYNLGLGSSYIGQRRDNFGNVMLAVAAYNAGAGNVRKWLAMNGDPRSGTDPIDWIEMIPFEETRTYVQRVTENAVVYSMLEPNRQSASPRVSRWLRQP